MLHLVAFPGHCEGFALFTIKPVVGEDVSRLRSFPNEQDEISCTYEVGCIGVIKKKCKFMSGKAHLVHADFLPLITQRTISDVYQ